MKKQMKKVKDFLKMDREEMIRLGYYTAGAVVGLAAMTYAEKVTYDRVAKRHPDWELVLRDRNGNYHGFNRIKEESE